MTDASPAPPRRAVLLGALATLVAARGAAADPAPSLDALADVPLHRIAFGSCADQTQPQPIWDAVLADRPDLFLFGGDNVYGDSPGPDLTELRAAYAQAQTIEGLRRLRASVPVMAVWDDHDMGRNDGGASYPHRQAAQRLFAEHWSLPPDDPRWTREGVHTARIFGPPGRRVQVVMLDTRSFRSPLRKTDTRGAPGRERYLPDDDPAKTMLGAVQWAWLDEQFRQPAEARLLLSSIQVLADGHGWERWGNLPLERQRLLSLIGRTNGVVLLSGDRHFGALYRESVGLPYPLTEITSSGLNRVTAGKRAEAGPNRLGERWIGTNFGRVELDWPNEAITLTVVDQDGGARRGVRLNIRDLRP